MHKYVAPLLLSMIPTLADAGVLSVDTRCFSNAKNTINVEFRAYTDSEIGWIGGQVKYRQSDEFIPLAFKGTETLREVPDRPWEFEHTWLEILDGKIAGQYKMVSQGAVIYAFTYTSKRSGKVVDISEQSYIDEDGACTWN